MYQPTNRSAAAWTGIVALALARLTIAGDAIQAVKSMKEIAGDALDITERGDFRGPLMRIRDEALAAVMPEEARAAMDVADGFSSGYARLKRGKRNGDPRDVLDGIREMRRNALDAFDLVAERWAAGRASLPQLIKAYIKWLREWLARIEKLEMMAFDEYAKAMEQAEDELIAMPDDESDVLADLGWAKDRQSRLAAAASLGDWLAGSDACADKRLAALGAQVAADAAAGHANVNAFRHDAAANTLNRTADTFRGVNDTLPQYQAQPTPSEDDRDTSSGSDARARGGRRQTWWFVKVLNPPNGSHVRPYKTESDAKRYKDAVLDRAPGAGVRVYSRSVTPEEFRREISWTGR